MHKCAKVFGIELTDLLEGHSAKLTGYTVTRKGQGLVTASEDGITIRDMAAMFRQKLATPYWVTYEYSEALQDQPIHTTTHDGQEFDLVLKGSMRVRVGDHEEVLHEGDSIFYKSSTPHGMIARGGAGLRVPGHDYGQRQAGPRPGHRAAAGGKGDEAAALPALRLRRRR